MFAQVDTTQSKKEQKQHLKQYAYQDLNHLPVSSVKRNHL